MKENNPPTIIYLQYYGSDSKEVNDIDNITIDDKDVTWCRDKIFEGDIEYRMVKSRKRKER